MQYNSPLDFLEGVEGKGGSATWHRLLLKFGVGIDVDFWYGIGASTPENPPPNQDIELHPLLMVLWEMLSLPLYRTGLPDDESLSITGGILEVRL